MEPTRTRRRARRRRPAAQLHPSRPESTPGRRPGGQGRRQRRRSSVPWPSLSTNFNSRSKYWKKVQEAALEKCSLKLSKERLSSNHKIFTLDDLLANSYQKNILNGLILTKPSHKTELENNWWLPRYLRGNEQQRKERPGINLLTLIMSLSLI
jgi:hypothetical protein